MKYFKSNMLQASSALFPHLVNAMERHGHLRITEKIIGKLLKVRPTTVDSLLQIEQRRHAE
jgi:hypothetical protein